MCIRWWLAKWMERTVFVNERSFHIENRSMRDQIAIEFEKRLIRASDGSQQNYQTNIFVVRTQRRMHRWRARRRVKPTPATMHHIHRNDVQNYEIVSKTQ